MATKIFIVAFLTILILFLLSVFGPMHSEKKFWKAIYKVRAGMDLCSYWFFNLCGIATILYVAYFVLLKLIQA